MNVNWPLKLTLEIYAAPNNLNYLFMKEIFNCLQCITNNHSLWKSTVELTVYYYDVTYAFQSESTAYSCLNVKELFAQNRHDLWSLSDSIRILTHNHGFHKQKLNHLVLVYELSVVGSNHVADAVELFLERKSLVEL